jgi:hypothetical protein
MNTIDNIFECELNLAMVKAGYDNLDNNIIDNYNHIISSKIYEGDDRINRLKKEFEKTSIIWGYKTQEYDIIEIKDEIKDLYKLICFYKQYENFTQENPLIYMKIIQRCIILKKIYKLNYEKYNKYYNYIINWAKI